MRDPLEHTVIKVRLVDRIDGINHTVHQHNLCGNAFRKECCLAREGLLGGRAVE